MSLTKRYIPPAEEPGEMEKHEQLVDLLSRLGNALELVAGAEYFDKALGEQIKEVLSLTIKEISKITKPITEIALDISKQNQVIIELVKKITPEKNDDSKYTELINRLYSMIEKSNELMQTGFKQVDYTEELKGIKEGLEKKEITYFIDNIKGRRNPHTGIREIESMTITVQPQNQLL